MTVALASGVKYELRFYFADAVNGGWCLDISDTQGNPIACGLPLVTGADLLAQFAYLGIGASLYVVSDGNASDVPTFANLGTDAHVYCEF